MEKEGSIGHFVQYHNAIPIALGFMFLSMTATFAASDDARKLVYSEEEIVRSVDNSYIMSVDLEEYDFRFRITEVTEDSEYYYLTYEFDTIDVADYIWQDITSTNVLRVAKALLGEGSLEAYAESELAQVRAAELARLIETQEIEKKIGERSKIVATVYSGLVGKFIDPKEEQVPQYVAETSENDPLFVEDPTPLVTWDANEEPEEIVAEEPEEEDPQQEEPAPEDSAPTVPPENETPSEEPAPEAEETTEPSVSEEGPEVQPEEETVPPPPAE